MHKLIVSKLDTVAQLRDSIAKELELDADSFKIFKGQITYKIELRDETETLKSLVFSNQQKLVIETGIPMKKGEQNVKFLAFDPNNQEKQITFLFQLALPSKMEVTEVKREVIEQFRKLQENPETKVALEDFDLSDPATFKLREFRGISPRKIFLETDTVKDLCQGLIYTVPEILIQKKQEEDDEKQSKEQLVLFLQQFCPSTFTLGKRFEFATATSEKLTSFRDRISAKTGIKNLAMVNVNRWEGTEILSIPKLKWTVAAKENEQNIEDEDDDSAPASVSYIHNLQGTVKSLYFTEGDLVLFQNIDEELKELTPEETAEIKKLDSKRRKAAQAPKIAFKAGPEARLVIKDHSKEVTI